MTFIGSLSGGSSAGGTSSSGQITYTPGSGISGLASGIDTDAMVNAMVQSAQVPLVQLLQQRQILQWQEMRYQQVNASLTQLQNTVQSMQLQSTFMQHSVTSSDSTVVSGTAGTLAPNGTYSVTVQQLAQGAMVYSSSPISTDPNYPSNTTLSSLGYSSGVTLTVNGQSFTFQGSDTLQTVLSQINGNTSAGVSTFYDANSGNVVMQTTATGTNAKIQVDDTTAAFFQTAFNINISSTNPPTGQNAQFTVNGYSTTSQTNQVNYNGLTLNLYATTSSPVTVTVGVDVDAIVNSIENFVQQYNQTLQLMQGLYNEQRNYDYQPLTTQQAAQMTQDQIEKWNEQAQSGMLANDPLLGSIMNTMEDDMQLQVSGQTQSTVNGQQVTLNSLAAIGITPIDPMNGVSSGAEAPGVTTTGWNTYGLLQIDPDQLRAAIQADPQAVMRLFTNNPQFSSGSGMGTGIAVQLNNDLTNAIQQLTDEAGTNPDIDSEIQTKSSNGTTIAGAGLLPYTLIDPNADFSTLFGTDSLDVSFLGQQISSMDTNAEDMQQQISDLQQRYQNEFSQMEQALAQLSSQSSYLSSMMGSSSSA
ncbi:flagellar hook-associated protein 2 [Alicyclobacillus contaminans]|uniref:flagellar filament capping protein FliD n=1 Tax=Alicyclobacillus contaminans TaxID=392016 RepID=UPI0003FB64D1|nr:flagellar filament capping protein FliD [Alicyclobacillus contaminans]GMA51306.1 flagellar hook-associated protein 2 [Alicyclobacillus contaminans]